MKSKTCIFLALTACALSASQASARSTTNGKLEQTFIETETNWKKIGEDLEKYKASTCSYLLAEIRKDGSDHELTLKKVTHLFESALDHLASTNALFGKLVPYVGAQVVEEFDRNGRAFVLELSLARTRLIEDYTRAEEIGSDAEILKRILEEAFYKACAFKLGTIVTEKSMYEAAAKSAGVDRPIPVTRSRGKLHRDQAAEQSNASESVGSQ